jgi:hypothetical protein
MNIYFSLKAACAALAAGLLAASAYAAPVTYGFEVSFASGNLSGQTAFGTFDVSDATCVSAVCSGQFTSAGPSGGADGTLLSFNITVDGTTFQLTNDSGFPDFPSIVLWNNQLSGIDFLADAALPSLALSFSSQTDGGPLLGSGSYIDPQGAVSLIGSVAAVPEPSTAWLIVIPGLVGAGLFQRRRRAVGNSVPSAS